MKTNTARRSHHGTTLYALVGAALIAPAAWGQWTSPVSAWGNNMSGDGWPPSISSDGRYVAYASLATNLVPGDTNGAEDIFVYDRVTGTTVRASVGPGGVQANAASYQPAISPDGRYIAFYSDASNLVSGDTNGVRDVFIFDRTANTTVRVGDGLGGPQGNGNSVSPSLSTDAQYVSFHSAATNLVSGDTNGKSDVFVFDRSLGTTARISLGIGGAQANGDSGDSVISADGRYVAFVSVAKNLVSGDSNNASDIFVHDRMLGTTSRVSVGPGGLQANGDSGIPAISADGRYVAFISSATNLVAGDTNATQDIFVYDRTLGTTTRVSVGEGGVQGNGGSLSPSISANGRYAAFGSWASNLVAGDTNSTGDVFVRDLVLGTTTLVSAGPAGVLGNSASLLASVSSDGKWVAFGSYASNLVTNDGNAQHDVFLRQLYPTGVAHPGYGPALAVQDTPTSLLNNTSATSANGSELDCAYGYIENGSLHLLLAGNIRNNAMDNLCLFFDTGSGGQNRLRGNNPNVTPFDCLNRMGDSGSGNGLRFEADFDADYFLSVGLLLSNSATVSFATLPTAGGGTGGKIGDTDPNTVDGTLLFAAPGYDIKCVINNTNLAGVSAGTGTSYGWGVRSGVELVIPLSTLGNPQCGIKVCAFLTTANNATVSNQVLRGIGGGAALGDPRNVNFAAVPGQQWFDAVSNVAETVRTLPDEKYFTPPKRFATSVAIAPDTYGDGGQRFVAVGAPGEPGSGPGAVYVYSKLGDGSGTVTTLQSPLSDGVSWDAFGYSVAISPYSIVHDDRLLVVGAPRQDGTATDSGMIAVYSLKADGSITLLQEITGGVSGSGSGQFGYAIAADHNRVYVGAPFDRSLGTSTGAVWVFQRNRSPYYPGQLEPGPILYPPAADRQSGMQFGSAVAARSENEIPADKFAHAEVLIGAWKYDDPSLPPGNFDSGAAYFFAENADHSWPSTPTQKLNNPAPAANDWFGYSLALDNNNPNSAIIGGHSIGAGRVLAYSRTDSSMPWGTPAVVTPADLKSGDEFGYSVALNNGVMVVGSHKDDATFADQGSAYVFNNIGGTWAEISQLVSPDAVAGEQFGDAVALSSAGQAIVGVPLADTVFGADAGSAYLFNLQFTAPAIVSIPGDRAAQVGSPANLTWNVSSPFSSFTYQVRHDNVVVQTGGPLAASNLAPVTYLINPADFPDAGAYDLVVTNACDSTTSRASTLSVVCPSDFNQDGFVSGEDFDLFVTAFELGDSSADFNRDGFVSGDDFDQFVPAFEAGC